MLQSAESGDFVAADKAGSSVSIQIVGDIAPFLPPYCGEELCHPARELTFAYLEKARFLYHGLEFGALGQIRD